MIRKAQIKNFTAFGHADLTLVPGLNVFVGENGTGKSHILKLLYTVLATSAEEGRKPNADAPTKALLQPRIAEKLVNVFHPESLGGLSRRKQGRERSEVKIAFDRSDRSLVDSFLDIDFRFSTQSKSEVLLEQTPKKWVDTAPVFLPTRELLTIYPGFVSVYEGHYLEFEETWRDTTNLNPKLIRLVAETIFHIRESGIQVFVATHSLFFVQELSILSNQHSYKKAPQRYFALKNATDGVSVSQGDTIEDVDPLVVLDENLSQSDRFLAETGQ